MKNVFKMTDAEVNKKFKISNTQFNRNRKLSDEEYSMLRDLYNTGKYSLSTLGRQFGITYLGVKYIVDADYRQRNIAAKRNKRASMTSSELANYQANLADYKRELVSAGLI